MATKPADHKHIGAVVSGLKLEQPMRRLREKLNAWIDLAEPEMREALRWQFQAGSKYFRPLTVFSCHLAVTSTPIDDDQLLSAQAIEMFHNVSLIIDDIVDGSTERRGIPTLHQRFGMLRALMTAGYIVADGYELLAREHWRDQEFGVYRTKLFSELMKRLGVAECLQWRLRRQPLGVEDWRRIAGEDTGSMFEICACLGGRGEKLRRFGRLLGTLYHGCDDVGDVRGGMALGGGGKEDLRDGILTLPAALAIRDPEMRNLFLKGENLDDLMLAYQANVPEAEKALDKLAEEAKVEAKVNASAPELLIKLVDHTRALSTR